MRRLVEVDCCIILGRKGSRYSCVPSGGVMLSPDC
jgi:hypothetical protein